LLAAALVLVLSPQSAIGSSDQGSAPVAPAGSVVKRTEFSTTTALADGSYQTQVSAAPMNFKDGAGLWQPIDTTVRPSEEPGYAYQNVTNGFHVYFPADISSGAVRFEQGSNWMMFSPVGEEGEAQASGQTVSYPNPTSASTITYSVNPGALQETVTFPTPASAHDLAYDLSLSPGLSASTDANGQTNVVASDGSIVFVLPTPTITDSSLESEPQPLTVALTRVGSPQGSGASNGSLGSSGASDASAYQLSYSLNQSWLTSSERVWPVSVDPTITPPLSVTCKLVNGADAGNTYCSQHLAVGYKSSDSMIRRSIVKFDIAGSVIPGTSPASATLSLYCTAGSTALSTSIRRMTQAVTWTNQATWNTYDSNLAHTWTTGGGSFGTSSYQTASKTCATAAWKSWDILSLVNNFLDGKYTDYGIGIRESASGENTNATLTFDSQTDPNPPKLTIVTDPTPAGLEGGGFQNVMAVDPSTTNCSPECLVSGGDDAGINTSSDGGQTWAPSNNITDSFNSALSPDLKVAAFDWVSDTQLFALVGNGTSGGVMLSTDRGSSWTMLNGGGLPIYGNGGDGTTADGLPSQFPRSTGTLIQVDSTDTYIDVGTYDQGVYRGTISTLTGSSPTWVALGLQPSGSQNFYTRSLSLDTVHDCLFASTYQGTSGNSAGADGQVWRIRSANSTPQTAQQLTGSPINTEEMVDFNSTLYGVAFDGSGNSNNGLWRLASASSVSTSAAWTHDTHLPTSSDPIWYSLTGYSTSSSHITLWAGSAEAGGTFTNRVYELSTTDTWSTETATPFPGSNTVHSSDVGGAPGDLSQRDWWLNSADNRNLLGGSLFAASQIIVDPTDSTHNIVWVAGKSGVWETPNGGSDWYPYVRKMGVTINHQVMVDPNAEDVIYVANTDYDVFNSINDMNTVAATIDQSSPTAPPTSGYAIAVDPTTTPTTVYVGVGDRNDDNAGEIIKNTDINGTGTWTPISLGPAGTNNPIGLTLTYGGGHTYLFAAVEGVGVYFSKDGGAFTQVTGGPAMTGENTKAAIFAWNPGSSYVYLYDRATGVWRGAMDGTGTWTEILTTPSNSDRTGYIATDPTSNSILYISNTAGVYKGTNADTAGTNGLSKTQVGSGTISNPGAIAVASTGSYLYVCERQTGSSTAKLWRAGLSNLSTWTDEASSAYRGAAGLPLSLTTNPEGTLVYVATDGDGVFTLDLRP
jgi:hypothetical protein